MIIHPKFVFAHIPRCGGNYVSKFLQENIGQCKRPTKSHLGLSDISEEDRNKVSFCTIRNPFDWYVSWWSYSKDTSTIKHLYKNGRKEDFNKFLKFIFVQNEWKTSWFDFSIMSKLDIGLMSFKFIRILMDKDKIFSYNEPLNIHPFDSLLVDYFIRLENINSDLDDFFKEYIFPLNEEQQLNLIALGKVNTSDHKNYTKYYNEESIELVKHKDRMIFEMFKYKFGD